ncbi:MAG: hypothetical protein HUJ98_11880, partial [Bacteroidaceae bacterium]|nr:hypothetical protein [Bacteroidales bacterium]MCF0187175.1 hypothetical protein [Bacteroidaceae bacterium]
MKRIITILCIALGLGMSFISCQREVPNIEFVNVVNHTADFSGIIAAIESQTTTLQQK